MDDQDEHLSLDSPPAPQEVDGASVIINMESMIKSHMAQIDKLNEEMGTYKDMLNDILENSSTYKEHTEKAKEANRIKNATKIEIMKQPQAADLSNKVKSVRSQVKELKGALSDYLREYQRLSGVNEIEGDDGEVREIVYVAKLVKKSARFRS